MSRQQGKTVTNEVSFESINVEETITSIGTISSSTLLSAPTLAISGTTDASSKDTGSAIFEGGVGIEKKLFAGTSLNAPVLNATASSSQIVMGTTNTVTINANSVASSFSLAVPDPGQNASFLLTRSTGTQTVASGKIAVSDATDATDSSNASVVLTGGMGIAKKLNVSGQVNANNGLVVSGDITQDSAHALNLQNTSNQIILGNTNTVTLNAAAPTSSTVITLPDPGASTAQLLLNKSGTTQTISSGKVVISNATAASTSSTGGLVLTGGLGITLNTDASSSTNGGALTVGGGAAIASKLYVGGNLTHGGTAPVGVNYVRIERGHSTSATSFTSSERIIAVGQSAIFSGTVDLTTATLDGTSGVIPQALFSFLAQPTAMTLKVRGICAASPGTITVTIRKASDGSSIETFPTVTTTGGEFSFTPTAISYASSTAYYMTWKNANSVNTSPSLTLTVLF